MKVLFRILIISLVAAPLLSGCAESERKEATGRGHVRGINGVLTSPAVVFKIEERSLGSINFRESSEGRRWDNLSYEFRFEVFEIGADEATRLVNIPVDLVADTDYIYVLSGSIASPDFLQWTQPERIFDGSETVFETGFGHAAPQVGQVDVYLDPDGTPPALGNEQATLSFGEFVPASEFPAGDYVVTLTAPGDPATVLFESRVATFEASNGTILTIFDPSPSITGNATVALINRAGASGDLVDTTVRATLRLMHTSFGLGNVDIYFQQDFTMPVATNIAFGQLTGDLTLPASTTTVSYTTAGDVDDVLLEADVTTVRGNRYSSHLLGPVSDLAQTSRLDDRRPRETSGRIRFVQNSSNVSEVDIYVEPAGADIADETPILFALPAPFDSGYVNLAADSYEITLTLPGEKTPIGTPLALDLAFGDVAEIAIVDTADAEVLDLILYGN